MNWFSIALAAASGGLAALLATAIFGKKGTNKAGYKITLVVAFIALHSISKQFILPKINAYYSHYKLESTLTEIPLYQTIKEVSPDTYNNIFELISYAKDNGYSEQQATVLARSEISKLVSKRLPNASDDSLINYMSVMVTEIDALQSLQNGVCYNLLFPSNSNGFSPKKNFSSELQQKDLEALNQVIISSNISRNVPSEDDVWPFFEPVIASLYSKHGEDTALLDRQAQNLDEKQKVCQITKDLYTDILNLPPHQAAMTLRWMFGQAT